MWSLVGAARGDSEAQRLLEPILAVMNPEAKESKRPAVEHAALKKRPQLPAETAPATKRQRSNGASSSSSSGCLQGQCVQGSSGPAPSVEDHVWRPGDWRCDECGNWNYASHAQCHFKHCRRSYVKPGDWTCPARGDHKFASREFCNAHKSRAPVP